MMHGQLATAMQSGGIAWYCIVEFNIPLDTVYVILETGALSSDVHLPFSNGGPAT